jgi:hypothetical protein
LSNLSDAPQQPQLPAQQPAPRPLPQRPHNWGNVIRRAVTVGVGIVLLGGGFAAGLSTGRSAIPGYQHQVARIRGGLTTEQGKLTADQNLLQDAQTQAQNAQTAAQNAQATARTQVLSQYRSKLAALKQQQQTLAREQRALKAEEGQIQASTISADGVYVVGKDITSGTWHTSGDGGSGDQCYYATLGSTNTSDILDNNNFDGPETVDLSGAYAFQISGPCSWVKVG